MLQIFSMRTLFKSIWKHHYIKLPLTTHQFYWETKKIVFLASPEPKTSEEKNWAWTQAHDDKNLINYLKIGNKAVLEAVSHRGTITKDTFELTGFTKALQRLQDICK